MSSNIFRTDINGLRAIAVITVVLFHFKLKGFEGGFVGVDIWLFAFKGVEKNLTGWKRSRGS